MECILLCNTGQNTAAMHEMHMRCHDTMCAATACRSSFLEDSRVGLAKPAGMDSMSRNAGLWLVGFYSGDAIAELLSVLCCTLQVLLEKTLIDQENMRIASDIAALKLHIRNNTVLSKAPGISQPSHAALQSFSCVSLHHPRM